MHGICVNGIPKPLRDDCAPFESSAAPFENHKPKLIFMVMIAIVLRHTSQYAHSVLTSSYYDIVSHISGGSTMDVLLYQCIMKNNGWWY